LLRRGRLLLGGGGLLLGRCGLLLGGGGLLLLRSRGAGRGRLGGRGFGDHDTPGRASRHTGH